MSTPIPTRKNVNDKYKWNISKLFASKEDWTQAIQVLQEQIQKTTAYEGTLREDIEFVIRFLDDISECRKNFEQISGYARLKYASDSTNLANQEYIEIIGNVRAKLSQALSFVNEELLSLSLVFLISLREEEDFAHYKNFIIKLIRIKPHILTKQEEALLAKQSSYENNINQTFSSLTDMDMKFGSIETPEGVLPLNHATISELLEHNDRNVRQKAYEQYQNTFNTFLYTLSNLYSHKIKKENALAKIRDYSSVLEAKLYEDNIPVELYHNLIKNAHDYFPVLHRYYSTLKNKLGLENYTYYDLRAPAFASIDHDMKYEEAVELVCSALHPLGDEYVSILKKGLTEERWVDRYENVGKKSGAFSLYIYDAQPFILLNYQSKSIKDVFTLAHEAGHSMHSLYAAKSNSYILHEYSVFESEITSSVNEYLLYKYLINQSNDKKTKIFLLWEEIQNFINSFFRQTLLAEYELTVYQYEQQGNMLTTEYFIELYTSLLQQYHGDALTPHALSGITGLRIPHLYYRNYYVYQYATGIAAAMDIGDRIYHQSPETIKGYLQFLQRGGSSLPVDSLKLVGIDYTSDQPIKNALEEFEKKCMLLSSLNE